MEAGLLNERFHKLPPPALPPAPGTRTKLRRCMRAILRERPAAGNSAAPLSASVYSVCVSLTSQVLR